MLDGQGLRIREDLDSLTPDELVALRASFAAMYAAEGERSYTRLASLADPAASPGHGGPLFLPWNRAYLHVFEQALQTFAPAVSLPWWDWSSERSRRDGIPPAFAAEPLEDGSGNPLAAAVIAVGSPPVVVSKGERPGPPRTSRRPGPAAELPTAAAVDELVALADFGEFSTRLEAMHDEVHAWVGGTLALVSHASWDPLYWVLQAMVDRIWWRWQQAHPSGSPDPSLTSLTLAPFATTAADVLDTVRLGYVYRPGPRPVADDVEVDPRVVADLPEPDDSLGFARVVDGIALLLNDGRTKLPLALGLSGRWGAGKSSLMQQLRGRLESYGGGRDEVRWYTVWLETWKYEGSERLWAALTKAVYEQSQLRMGRFERVWFRARLEWRRRTSKGAGARRFDVGGLLKWLLTGVGPALVPFAAALFASMQARSQVVVNLLTASGIGAFVVFTSRYWGLLADPFKRAIQGYVDRAARDPVNQVGFTTEADKDVHCLADVLLTRNRALAIFVDDLDRCSPTNVVELVETVNQVFNSFPGRPCVFLLGMDREIVVSSIEAHFSDIVESLRRAESLRAPRFGSDFLDKILQLTIRVPEPTADGMERLLERITGNTPPGRTPSPPAAPQAMVARYQAAIRRAGVGPSGEISYRPAGVTLGQSEEAALQEAIARERARHLVETCRDTGSVAEAEYYLLPRLRRNPRLLKRFDNAFRLQLWVAVQAGQRPLDVDTMIALGRWVALALQWPDLADDLAEDALELARLDNCLNAAEGITLTASTRRWMEDPYLKLLLQDATPARRIAAISPESFLRLS